MKETSLAPEAFIGYVESENLPFKRGEVITIPSGIKVRSTNPSKREYQTKRKQKIRIFSVDNGADMDDLLYEYEIDRYGADKDAPVVERMVRGSLERRRVLSNPAVVFIGSGGYYCKIEIRDLLLAEQKGRAVTK